MADKELPWQTAFWCVVAVALNTMSQPAGRTLGLSSKYSFYIKSSPIVCLSHAFHTVGQVLEAVALNASFSDGLAVWKESRFDDATAESEDSFESFRKNSIVRAISFILGALLPALKLCACKGIPWSQTLCAIYLVCFALDETVSLAFTLTRPSIQYLPLPQRVPLPVQNSTAVWVIIAFDCSLLGTLLAQGLLGSIKIIETKGLILISGLPSLMAALLTGGLARDDVAFRPLCLLAHVCLGPLFWTCSMWILRGSFLPAILRLKDHDNPLYVIPVLLGLVIGHTILFLVVGAINFVCVQTTCESTSTQRYMAAVATRLGSRLELFSARLHAACWLIVAVLLYARLYDSESTYDPRWLRIFG